ncbi:MAG: hypothetical protein ACP6IY_10210, partial [Promethearchaeia archaeon]
MSYFCRFCGNILQSEYSKCYNIYCNGQKFNIGNFILDRCNIERGIGRIIKIIRVPASRRFDAKDTFEILKYKVIFNDNFVKILHPIDLIHYIFKKNERILTKFGLATINSDDFFVKDGKISYEAILENGKLTQIDESEIIEKYKDKTIDSILKNGFCNSRIFFL